MSQMVEHYEIVDNPDVREMCRVRLLKEPYKGVEYAYGNLKFIEIQGEPVVKFIFEVFVNPNNMDLEQDREFKKLISDILDEVLRNLFTNDGE